MLRFTFLIENGLWYDLKVRVKAYTAIEAFSLVNHRYGKNNIKLIN